MSFTAFTIIFYLIFSGNFAPIHLAPVPFEKEQLSGSGSPKKAGPSVDLMEQFDELQVPGPFSTNPVLKTSWSSGSLNSISSSSGRYSPLARLALSNSPKENLLSIKGDDKVTELITEVCDEDEKEDDSVLVPFSFDEKTINPLLVKNIESQEQKKPKL